MELASNHAWNSLCCSTEVSRWFLGMPVKRGEYQVGVKLCVTFNPFCYLSRITEFRVQAFSFDFEHLLCIFAHHEVWLECFFSKSAAESARSPHGKGHFPKVWEEVLILILEPNWQNWLAELFRNLALPWLQSFFTVCAALFSESTLKAVCTAYKR